MEKNNLHIAVGIIRNTKQEIFIIQRAANSHMCGFWQFPGGKFAIGETRVEALLRELKEEIRIDVINSQLLQVQVNLNGNSSGTIPFSLSSCKIRIG